MLLPDFLDFDLFGNRDHSRWAWVVFPPSSFAAIPLMRIFKFFYCVRWKSAGRELRLSLFYVSRFCVKPWEATFGNRRVNFFLMNAATGRTEIGSNEIDMTTFLNVLDFIYQSRSPNIHTFAELQFKSRPWSSLKSALIRSWIRSRRNYCQFVKYQQRIDWFEFGFLLESVLSKWDQPSEQSN